MLNDRRNVYHTFCIYLDNAEYGIIVIFCQFSKVTLIGCRGLVNFEGQSGSLKDFY